MLLCCMRGCLDSFRSVASLWGYTCQAVSGFTTFTPCLEHICAGGEGSVAIWVWYCYVGGDYIFTP